MYSFFIIVFKYVLIIIYYSIYKCNFILIWLCYSKLLYHSSKIIFYKINFFNKIKLSIETYFKFIFILEHII